MAQYVESEETELDLVEIFFVLWKRAGFIILIAILMGLLGFIFTKGFMTDIYQSSAKMIVNSRSEQSTAVTNDQIVSAQKLVDTYSIILRSRTVLQPIIENLNLSSDEEPMKFEALQALISVTSVNGTQVMEISVEHPDPQIAHNIVSQIIEISPEIILSSVEAGSVKTIEYPIVPDNPVKPSAFLNAVIMALLGGVITVSAILITHIMDNTFKSETDIERYLNLPAIGVTPTLESCKTSKGGY